MDTTLINLSKTSLGIELGSTRIKAILMGEDHSIIASGEYEWENKYVNNLWTYELDEVWTGLQEAYKQLAQKVEQTYQTKLHTVGAIGFSGMMHGYLAFDQQGELLAPFRTWRNTNTQQAADVLTDLFQFNIPLRWSVAHLYQAILDQEKHVQHIDYLTTLAGYVHWKLTEQRVIGIGDAAGMFPIDDQTMDYHQQMLDKFASIPEVSVNAWSVQDILPEVHTAGMMAGHLTEVGAKLLDPTGTLQAGIPLCPPEGDAGTGMVATNAIKAHTGNVSAGTSIFSMIVLDKHLSSYYKEIDIVNTPAGNPVAMVHCNNFTSDLNAWVGLFKEFSSLVGLNIDNHELFSVLFKEALKADQDVGNIVHCNYYAGEPITGINDGRPLFARQPDSNFNIANFMRSNIYAALATLEIGMEILKQEEHVQIDYLLGHGGFFKTEKVGQQMMADALNIPTSVMKTAGEGGPWGMAILALYALNKNTNQTLEDYLDHDVFSDEVIQTMAPSEEGRNSFLHYLENYQSILQVEKSAIQHFNNC